MIYNILGDTHGQTKWKSLILSDAINIFVGDYFSPYYPYPFEDLEKNFLEIVEYKKSNPDKVVLLLGNHDLEYFYTAESYSRHDRLNESRIEKLFKDNLQHFQMAYSIENNVLVTHAGVTKQWFDKVDEYFKSSTIIYPDEVAKIINRVFESSKDNYGLTRLFEFSSNAATWDYCGESSTQSCVWIRPWVLRDYDVFKDTDYKQVFGHTINKYIAGVELRGGFDEGCLTAINADNANDFNLYMVDCLSYGCTSLTYDSDTDKFWLNNVHDKSIDNDKI